jgi:hypothetical protein
VCERPLGAEEGAALCAALRGEPLAAVCAQFAGPDAAVAAARTVRRWLRAGWLVDQEDGDA